MTTGIGGGDMVGLQLGAGEAAAALATGDGDVEAGESEPPQAAKKGAATTTITASAAAHKVSGRFACLTAPSLRLVLALNTTCRRWPSRTAPHFTVNVAP